MTDVKEEAATAADAPTDPGTMLLGSPNLAGWLAAEGVSLAFTTYQAGRLFLIGRKPDGSMRAHERLYRPLPGTVDRRRDLVDQRQDRALAFPQRSSARADDGDRRRPPLRPARRPGDRGDRHPRYRGRRRRRRPARADLRQHRLQLPGDPKRAGELPDALDAALHQRAGPRGPLPFERPRHGRGAAGVRQRGQPLRRRRRLARPAARRRRDRRCRARARSSPRACPCRIRRASMAAGSGC